MKPMTTTASGRSWRPALIATGASALMLVVVAYAQASPQSARQGTRADTSARKIAVLSTASTPVGTIVATGKGRAVYIFAADSKGKSRCDAACLVYWPAVIAPATVPSSLPGITGKVGVLKRNGGLRQLTINGWPLYTYKADTAAGSFAGQGSAGFGAKWWVVSPSGAQITKATPASTPSPGTPTTPAATPAPGYPAAPVPGYY